MIAPDLSAPAGSSMSPAIVVEGGLVAGAGAAWAPGVVASSAEPPAAVRPSLARADRESIFASSDDTCDDSETMPTTDQTPRTITSTRLTTVSARRTPTWRRRRFMPRGADSIASGVGIWLVDTL